VRRGRSSEVVTPLHLGGSQFLCRYARWKGVLRHLKLHLGFQCGSSSIRKRRASQITRAAGPGKFIRSAVVKQGQIHFAQLQQS
jgi:hypothetical protein